ncbi:hypothetical protein AB0368_33140 [Actinoplanes sp. NPDC051475]|uniref:hypothetical protein n=1 Tax=Actinoplanes sp. NPDC051475 TaxID=3157225 RepID=UPI003450D80C
MPAEVLLDRAVQVNYGQLYVLHDGGGVEAEEAFRGQVNGLCGAADDGALFLVTGLRSGPVGFVVERHSAEPAIDGSWEEIVESSFRAASDEVVLQEWSGIRYPLDLDPGPYRVRYCAKGMDRGWDVETLGLDDEVVDTYLLQIWPGPPLADRIVRQTSDAAGYWHREHGGQSTVEHDDEARQQAAEQELEDRRRFGDRTPNERLRSVKTSVAAIRRLDEELMHALADVDDPLHRAVARWAALRALTAAGMNDVPALAPAIAALRQGQPTPPPFDDEYAAMTAIEDAVPLSTVPSIAVLRSEDSDRRESVQQWNAMPALAATAQEDSLEAALDAVVFATIVHGNEAYEEFLAQLWDAFPQLRG